MSGEYFCTSEPANAFYKSFDHSPVSRRTPTQNHRLHDIEEQLEMAESKCNTLKDQLDHMKEIYGLRKQPGRSRKISSITPIKKHSDGDVTSSSISNTSAEGKSMIKRQNSNAIETDNTGAAVRTINNILNGITNSVNRLSELHVQIGESPGRRTPHPVFEVNIENMKEAHPHSQIEVEVQPATNNTIRISTKSKNIKKKVKEGKAACKKTTSHQSVKRTFRSEKRSRVMSTRTSTVDRVATKPFRDRKSASFPTKSRSAHLVEIYHNLAAKNSDSDDGQLNKTKKPPTRSEETQADIRNTCVERETLVKEVPPLNIPDKPIQGLDNRGDESSTLTRDKITQNEDVYEPPEAPRTVSCYSKNYELPTIASRMKQAAKYYLNTFNFKAIPFCAAISTSPSHNIGINIQQVMNIIKNRQPINGISPTLAHNIGLAADRLNSKPLSALVSTITSKTCYKSSRCPLSRPFLNYDQLQDMAKCIPEESPEEIEDDVDSPEIQTVIITGPSGDTELKTRKATAWTMEGFPSDQCTCVPQSGVDFQHIINKYKKGDSRTTSNTIVIQKNRWPRNPQPKFRKETKKIRSKEANGLVATTKDTQSADDLPLQGKEKNLKDVLMNLHTEFEDLNKKYEDLCQKTNSDDEETLKELELLEKELNKKEEEITMVMTLYKEVLALKQQIKCLKQKTSQGSIATTEVNETSSNFSNYSNPKAAMHLTKLLRQIQTYQMRYKQGNAV